MRESILFLDVDGVLNCFGTPPEPSIGGYMGVDASKCELLRKIIRETGAEIVLSSTWRKHPPLLPYLWRQLGDDVRSRLIGQTPVLDKSMPSSLLYRGHTRGDEISAWLAKNPPVDAFVILDDDTAMGDLAPHHIATTFSKGLTEEIADRVIQRLTL